MADRIRIGVIGVGAWANRVHIPQILSHAGAELVALCARSRDKLKAAGDAFNVSALYTDFETLLNHEGLDAVTISSTHNAHYPIAKAALERGLHVFCEKPLGVNSRQTRELADLAETSACKTLVAFTNRWVPEALYAKQLVDQGYCGEVFHYNICQLAGYGGPLRKWMWRADPELGGGGVLFDLGCHNIDLALWLNGPIEAVCAHQKNTVPEREQDGAMQPTPVDDTSAFLARFTNGTQAVFHVSWTTPGDRLMRHEIVGRDGFLVLSLYHDAWTNALRGVKAGEQELTPLRVPDELQGAIPRDPTTMPERDACRQVFLEQHPSLARAFIDCILQDTDPHPSFADGHATQAVMDAVILSHQEKRWVAVEG